ncbi:uncharacterized protein [Drosophila tropicalis]|uniref:uncharacterized protein n=1 Tax=Drosophila tropicalis TaxID=46794 RepID=UPI0035ABA344
MGFPIRIVNCLLLIVTAILEIIGLVFLILLLSSHCVLGGEYGISVWLYIYFLPGITAQSLVLAIFRLCCNTVGLDPIALAFNFASGIVCLITALVLLVAMIDHCGNEFAYMFYASGVCGLVAGLLHLLNACLCNIYMPNSEWRYLKPSKYSRSRAEQVSFM